MGNWRPEKGKSFFMQKKMCDSLFLFLSESWEIFAEWE